MENICVEEMNYLVEAILKQENKSFEISVSSFLEWDKNLSIA